MVVYPRQPHGPTEPKFVLDVMRRYLDLAKRHLGVRYHGVRLGRRPLVF